MLVELLDICEMPWLAALNPTTTVFPTGTLGHLSTALKNPTLDPDLHSHALHTLLSIGTQPRSSNTRFDGVDVTLYQDVATAYDTYYRPHAVRLLTAPTLSAEEEDSWTSFKTACVTAWEALRDRMRRFAEKSNDGMLRVLDNAPSIVRFVLDGFEHTGLLRRVPFLTSHLLEDLQSILGDVKEGLREVSHRPLALDSTFFRCLL